MTDNTNTPAEYAVGDQIEMLGRDGCWYEGEVYEVREGAIFAYLLELGWHVRITLNAKTPPIRKGWRVTR